MSTQTFHYCDICDSNGTVYLNKATPVVFVTEQTEGRMVDPYLTLQAMDICSECLKRMANNRELPTGSGAQGRNKYWFNES